MGAMIDYLQRQYKSKPKPLVFTLSPREVRQLAEELAPKGFHEYSPKEIVEHIHIYGFRAFGIRVEPVAWKSPLE